RAAVFSRARLIKTDMTRSADSQDLQVDTVGFFNFVFIPLAMIVDLFQGKRAVGYMNVLPFDINVIKEAFIHKPDITLLSLRINRIVLVKVKCNSIFKA